MSKRVLLDMDGILADLHTEWFRLIEEKYGEKLNLDTINDWSMSEASSAGKAIYRLLDTPGLFLGLKPMEGAQEAVAKIQEAGHTVVVVTAATFPGNVAEKMAWMSSHFPNVGKDYFTSFKQKHFVKGDVLVDDKPDNAIKYRGEWPNAQVLTIGYPYNKDCEAYTKVCGSYKDTAAAWAEIVEEILRT